MVLKTATIESGKVRGVLGANPRISVFKGIPYAAPTSGANRFRPPQPAQSWNGERVCDRFSPICIQEPMPNHLPFGQFFRKEFYPVDYPQGEDSLCLNIWTPAQAPDEELPVMFWIHGGGLGSGYGHEMEFDGEAIAKRGIVLVTINYRVGPLGFFAHPELSAQNEHKVSGNLGILDQLAALKWVNRNIDRFGGDPKSITIFGQSAGGGSVISHMISPLTQGLFSSAIIQSGAFGVTAYASSNTLQDAEAWGEKVCKLLGKSLDDLIAMDAQSLQAAMTWAEHNGAGPHPKQVCDKYVFPVSPGKAVREGRLPAIPLMSGVVSGDGGLGLIRPQAGEDEETHLIRHYLGESADDFVKAYPLETDGRAILRCLKETPQLGDLMIARHRSKESSNPAYLYYFNPYIPGSDEFGFVKDGEAYHSSELWYVFGTLARSWRPYDGRHYDLSNRMIDYWTNFAKTGSPNGMNLPRWQPYQASCQQMMNFKETGCTMIEAMPDAVRQYLSFLKI